jgi:hypothetical protein
MLTYADVCTVTALNPQGPVMALFDESLKSPLETGKFA